MLEQKVAKERRSGRADCNGVATGTERLRFGPYFFPFKCSDDFSYNIVRDPVHIRDFHATVLHLLGFDHQRFTYKYKGSTSG